MEPNNIDAEMKESVSPVTTQVQSAAPAKTKNTDSLFLMVVAIVFLLIGIFYDNNFRIYFLLFGILLLWFVHLSKQNPQKPWVNKLLHPMIKEAPVTIALPISSPVQLNELQSFIVSPGPVGAVMIIFAFLPFVTEITDTYWMIAGILLIPCTVGYLLVGGLLLFTSERKFGEMLAKSALMNTAIILSVGLGTCLLMALKP